MKSFSGKGVGSVYLHFCDYSGTSVRERGLIAKESWKPMDPRKFCYDVRVRPNDRPALQTLRVGVKNSVS